MKDHKLTFFFVKISVWKITIYNCIEHNANDQMKKKQFQPGDEVWCF